MTNLSQFNNFTGNLPLQDTLMPVLFIGHGSPMNGITDNEFSSSWAGIARDIQRPKAVLVVPAHWYTRGTLVPAMDFPKTIHDFWAFRSTNVCTWTAKCREGASLFNDKALGGSLTMTSVRID